MTTPPSRTLLDVLATAGVGVVGTNLFAERMPDAPDHAVSVTLYAGGTPEYIHNSPYVAYNTPRLQVMVRGVGADSAYTLADAAYRALGNKDGYPSDWIIITPLSAPFLLTRDEKERVVYAFNIEALTRGN